MNLPFKGRKNTADLYENTVKKFAVFFLLSISFINPLQIFAREKVISDSNHFKPVFMYEGKVCTFDGKGESVTIKTLINRNNNFKSRNIGGDIYNLCAWNSTNEKLCFLKKNGNQKSQISLKAGLVRTNGKFLYAQDKNFDDGFIFTFYKINKPSFFAGKPKLIKLFESRLDCFISDTVFSDSGIWFCGGNTIDSENSIYYVDFSDCSVRRLFTVEKDNNFLRLILSDEDHSVYAFLSSRIKQKGSLKLYKVKDDATYSEIDLEKYKDFPETSIGFFGFGLSYRTDLLLPVVTEDKKISICVYNSSADKISCIYPDSNGLFLPIGIYDSKAYYIAKDPLANSDISNIICYNGNEFKIMKNNN